MIEILGRRVILTTLDPIPPGLRTLPYVIAMNQRELDAFNACEEEMFKFIVDTIQAADRRDALRIGIYKRWKASRRLKPSDRMFMANAILKRR